MNDTLRKFTVRLYCENRDEMVDMKIATEDEGQEVFDLAEELHNSECQPIYHGVKNVCQSESSRYSTGWGEDFCLDCEGTNLTSSKCRDCEPEVG